MSNQDLDPVIKAKFPGARFIERVESTVLKHGNKAIHVYPAKIPRGAIEVLANGQNALSQHLKDNRIEVKVGRRHMPVRATRIQKVGELADGRVFTVSPFNNWTNFETIQSNSRQKPSWVARVSDFQSSIQLFKDIDGAIVHSIGEEKLPIGYFLSGKNLHLGERSITIVDMAAVIGDIVLEISKTK